MTPLEQALEAERLQLSLICSLVRLRDMLAMATDLLATASFTNGTDPPYVQTKSTRNERRKRWFSGWRRRALKSARDHEKREAAETVQAAERKHGFVTTQLYRRTTRRLNVRRVRLREISRMALFRALLK